MLKFTLWFFYSECHSIPRTSKYDWFRHCANNGNIHGPSILGKWEHALFPHLHPKPMIPDLTNHRVHGSKITCGVCGNWGKDCMSSCNPHGSAARSSRTSHQAQMNTTETCKSRPILSLSPSHLDGLGTTGKRRARASNPTLAVPRVHVYILVDEASERCL